MKSAVLVIDVQHGLFEEAPRPFEADKVVEKINRINAAARKSKVPVIIIQHESPEGILKQGSKGWELQPDLNVQNSDIIVSKTTPDSFLLTNLEEILTSAGVKNLIICGCASEFCVDTTTRRAAALGFDVQLVSDAHTTHDKPHATAAQIRNHHNATLPNIASFGSKITAVNCDNIKFHI